MKRPETIPADETQGAVADQAKGSPAVGVAAFSRANSKGKSRSGKPVTVVDDAGNVQYKCEVCHKLFNKNCKS